MKPLTKQEIELLFWALIDYYPKYEKDRKLVKKYDVDQTKKEEALKRIDAEEKSAYNILAKLAPEVNVQLPSYVSFKKKTNKRC